MEENPKASAAVVSEFLKPIDSRSGAASR